MNFKKNILFTFLSLIILLLVVGCENNSSTEFNDNDIIKEIETINEDLYSDWTEETHSNSGDLDYDTVFPQDNVNRIDIVISEENWELMMNDMEGLYGEFGSKSNSKPDDVDDESSSSDKPIYIETDIYFNDTEWYNVGMKFKGHSSLKSAWSAGNLKLPFKLNFDKFEDSYEELKNQRFFGFKKLSFSSNFNDDSFIHEKLATETFEQAGIVAPNSAFYRIYVNYGNGSEYFGLYTGIEVIDDTVIDKFSDEEGNLYEAEGNGITLAENTFDEISTHYEKKNNEDEADWSDIEKLSEVLNSDNRLTDTETWRTNLEEVFDVDVFLNWLAVNSTIQNWDTYGVMTHNFYLYNNPANGKLTWIPWDNNESFGPGKKGIVTLTANSVGDDWPLIRFLIDDEEYKEQYIGYVQEFNDNVLNTTDFTDRIQELHDMISPYIIGENGENEGYTFLKNESSFTNSVSSLISYIEGRIKAASAITIDNDWLYNESSNQRGGGMIGGGGRPVNDFDQNGDNNIPVEGGKQREGGQRDGEQRGGEQRGGEQKDIPEEAINACINLDVNNNCSFAAIDRDITGTCTEVEEGGIVCSPEGIPGK